MTNYVKLIDRNTGKSTDFQCNLADYLTEEGLLFFDRKRWRHAFVRIPNSFVLKRYQKQFAVFAIETEPLLVGKIAEYRKLFPGTRIKISCDNGRKLLYRGTPDYYPEALQNYEVLKTSYDGSTLSMEVDYH